jgi:predicted permease
VLTDLRLGLRYLLRQPFASLTAVVALTVGIGLATVGFATMEAMMYSRLPFEGGDRFVRIRAQGLTDEGWARVAAAPSLVHVGAAAGGRDSVTLPSGEVAELAITRITPSSFPHLRAVPLAGRTLVNADAVAGAPPAALVSERLAGRSAVQGSLLEIGTTKYTVVGVMPGDFGFPDSPDLWIPLEDVAAGQTFGVRAEGASLEQVAAQLAAIAPATPVPGDRLEQSLVVTDFTDLGDMAPLLSSVIVIAVLSVLMVIAANVGNLILARSFSRAREFALRAALGASRGRLVMQVMTEVLVLGVIAAVFGSLGAQAVLRQFNAMDEVPYWINFTGGPLTFVMVAGVTLLAAAIAGAWPALKATRRDVLEGIQGGDHRTSDVRFGRTAAVMLVTQIAVSIVMLHGALVVAQAFRSYQNVRVALPANVLTMGFGAPGVTAAEAERIVAAVPGVIAVGAATSLPRHSPAITNVEIEPAPGAAPLPTRRAPAAAVSPTYFAALQSGVTTGRGFTERDADVNAPAVAIVNEPFARELFGGAALGRRFRAVSNSETGPWLEVVGIVPDLALSVGDPSLAAGYYVPLTKDAEVVYLAMRVNGDPLRYAEPVRRALREQLPTLEPYRATALADVNMEDRAFFAGLSSALVGLGVVTLVLALAGVYSMMSLIVSRRTREIGIRLALGANVSHVVHTIGSRAALQIAIGGVIGAALAIASLNARSILVSRMGDGGAWTLPLVLALLVVAGLAATWVPLRRALTIRPQDALRAD